jgi:hypothetical protein
LSRKQTNTNVGKNAGGKKPLYAIGGNVNYGFHYVISMAFPQETKNRTTT